MLNKQLEIILRNNIRAAIGEAIKNMRSFDRGSQKRVIVDTVMEAVNFRDQCMEEACRRVTGKSPEAICPSLATYRARARQSLEWEISDPYTAVYEHEVNIPPSPERTKLLEDIIDTDKIPTMGQTDSYMMIFTPKVEKLYQTAMSIITKGDLSLSNPEEFRCVDALRLQIIDYYKYYRNNGLPKPTIPTYMNYDYGEKNDTLSILAIIASTIMIITVVTMLIISRLS